VAAAPIREMPRPGQRREKMAGDEGKERK